jgi:murein DD-endopeptidase MepM/ murein hydrolase activator NlpD/muramidase (phage lysozyme)
MQQPFCRVEVGQGPKKSQVFEWGDGLLRSVSVTLGEMRGLSRCSFSVYDEDRKITERFFTYIKEIEGLEPAVDPAPPGSTSLAGAESEPALKAVLDMIAWAEGTTAIASSDNGYNVLFGGRLFGSYKDHPRIRVRRGGFNSTAAGRYQILDTTWDGVKNLLSPPATTFEPLNQDRAAIQLLKGRGAYEDALAKNWPALLDKIYCEWTSLPNSSGTYCQPGQGTKTPQEVYDFLNSRVGTQKTREESQQEAAADTAANASKRSAAVPGRSDTLAGQQITIWLGFDGKPLVAYSFIHTSLSYSLYDESTLEFGGTAAAWVMHQAPKNSAYTNLSLKQLAEKIAANYGLKVDMKVDGPRYVYIQQKALSDYEFLLRECERVGLIIKNVGNNTLEIKTRQETLEGREDSKLTILSIGKNLTSFSISHEAQSGGDGARSSDPGERNSTGVKKFTLNPDTGEIESSGIAEGTDAKGGNSIQATTGSNLAGNHPLTTGVTDLEDTQRKANEQRVKGIKAEYSVLSTPETLVLTPDDPIRTQNLGGFLDRIWVHESITHSLGADSGFVTSGEVYTPLKNKYPDTQDEPASSDQPASEASSAAETTAPNRKANGFIRPVASKYPITSPFGLRNGRQHRGIDFGTPIGTNAWASKEGTVIQAVSSCSINGFLGSDCGGGFGNYVRMSHTLVSPSGQTIPFQTVYAHLSSLYVSVGDSVKQGEPIGGTGNSGSSTGPHLHFEILQNGEHRNPQQFIGF